MKGIAQQFICLIIFLGYLSLYHFYDPINVITYTVYAFMVVMFFIAATGAIVSGIEK